MAFKDEFISRDPQLPSQGPVPSADMRQGQRARVAQAAAPLGTPPADYTVRSVYDSRPISGQDFNIVLDLVQPETDPTGSYAFSVPQGYVGVLREVNIVVVTEVPDADALVDVLISLQQNGADVPYNTDIPVGLGTSFPIKCFVLADEFQTLGVRLASLTGNPNEFLAYCYGNFLLKTGRPYPFEIGNYAGRANVTQPGMAEASSPAGIPEAATQVHGYETGGPVRRRYLRRPR